MTQVEAPWAKVPLSLLDERGVTLADVRVYAYINFRAGKRQWWYGRQQEIAEATGIVDRTVRRSIDSLRAWGFIGTERLGADQGTCLLYTVTPTTAEAGNGATGHSRPIALSDRTSSSGATGHSRPIAPFPDPIEHTTDTKLSVRLAAPSSLPEQYRVVEDYIGSLGSGVAETIGEFIEQGFTAADFRLAVEKARRQDVRSWKYVAGILDNREPGFAAAEERAAAERRKRKPEVARDPERALPDP